MDDAVGDNEHEEPGFCLSPQRNRFAGSYTVSFNLPSPLPAHTVAAQEFETAEERMAWLRARGVRIEERVPPQVFHITGPPIVPDTCRSLSNVEALQSA